MKPESTEGTKGESTGKKARRLCIPKKFKPAVRELVTSDEKEGRRW